jgi:transcriptional regulator
MHPNSAYHGVTDEENLKFAVHRGFGTWVAVADDEIKSHLIATAPFYYEAGKLKAHLVRHNPLAKNLYRQAQNISKGIRCTLIVSGPDSYISPDWYGMDDQVPTWNYVSVHIHGRLHILPDCELRTIIDKLSATFESRLSDLKPVWTSSKMESSKMSTMMRSIVPIEFIIESIEGTWKLGQAKPTEARFRVAAQLAALSSIDSVGPLGLGMEHSVFARIHEKEFGGKHDELTHSKTKRKHRNNDVDSQFHVPFWAFMAVCIALFISLNY